MNMTLLRILEIHLLNLLPTKDHIPQKLFLHIKSMIG
nr:MAG TPA: hypothetical protein [Caudoviricetes sp.]